MMKTFMQFLTEAPGDPATPAPAGGATPAGIDPAGGAPGQGLGTPASGPGGIGMGGGSAMPGGGPPGGAPGGMGADPSMGGMGAAGGAPPTPPVKYKSSNVWDVMEKILAGKKIGVEKDKNSSPDNTPPVVNSAQLPTNDLQQPPNLTPQPNAPVQGVPGQA